MNLLPGTSSVLHVEEPPGGVVPALAPLLGQPARVRRRHRRQRVAPGEVLALGLLLAVVAAAVLAGRAPAAGAARAGGGRAPVGAAPELGVLAAAALLRRKMEPL